MILTEEVHIQEIIHPSHALSNAIIEDLDSTNASFLYVGNHLHHLLGIFWHFEGTFSDGFKLLADAEMKRCKIIQ